MKGLNWLSLLLTVTLSFDTAYLHSQVNTINHLPFASDKVAIQSDSDSASPADKLLEDEEELKLPSSDADTSSDNEEKDVIEVPPFERILTFWFGTLTTPAFYLEEKANLWLSDSAELDRQLLDLFGDDVQSAARGKYNSWRSSPRGRLALILLLDQFPRHMYRNQSRQFMFDRMAQGLAVEGVREGDDKRLYPIERAFFYLPLEHAESPELQDLSVASYEQLVVDAPIELQGIMQQFLQGALQQRHEISQFGRFPRRNSILNRESTLDEKAFLAPKKKNKDQR